MSDAGIAHGVVFEGGSYRASESFDPVVTSVLTDSTTLATSEPLYNFVNWTPSTWDVINSVRTRDGLSQNLVVVPAQYSATSPTTGTQRVFDTLTYTVYRSDKKDGLPPNVWRVQAIKSEDGVHFNVETTDFSGIVRVAVSYTDGAGVWYTYDLTEGSPDSNEWQGLLTGKDNFHYFVQVVDAAGNVSVIDNKGAYFTPHEISFVFLPVVLRQ
jgi:hypothetical protein